MQAQFQGPGRFSFAKVSAEQAPTQPGLRRRTVSYWDPLPSAQSPRRFWQVRRIRLAKTRHGPSDRRLTALGEGGETGGLARFDIVRKCFEWNNL